MIENFICNSQLYKNYIQLRDSKKMCVIMYFENIFIWLIFFKFPGLG